MREAGTAATRKEASDEASAEASGRALAEAVARDSIRILTLWVGAIYLIFIPVPFIRFPLATAVKLAASELVSASLLFGIRFALLRNKIPATRIHAALAATLAVPIVDILVRTHIVYAPDRVNLLALAIIASGLFSFSSIWLAALLALAAGGWGALVWLSAGAPTFDESALPILIASLTAAFARATRVNAMEYMERLRRQDAQHLREAQANEAKFRGIVNRIHDVFFQTDFDGTIQLVSPSVKRFGYSDEELIGKNASRIYADPSERERLLALLLEKRQLTDFEVTLRRKSGEPISVALTATLRFDDQGHPVGLEGLLHDVSERKQVETRQKEEAREAAALARVGRELISSLNDPTLLDRLCGVTAEVLDCDFSHTYLWQHGENAYALEAAYGHSREQRETMRAVRLSPEVIKDFLVQLRHEEVILSDLSQRDHPLSKLGMQLGITRVLHVALRRGEEIVGFQAAGFRNRQGDFSTAQARIAKGLGYLASLALENARLVSELGRASQLKSDFVATMSHELRTPLNVVMGYNSLLLDRTFGNLTQEQVGILERMDSSTRELLDLINATLDLSRLERGELPLDLNDVYLSDLMNEIYAETEPEREKSGLRFGLDLPPTLPPIRTDRVKLKVVLKNLIANAVKFTREGRVNVSLSERHGGVEICVTDTGIGIAPDVLPTIFEPFRQGDSSLTRTYGGVGLGLYIVRRLLDMIGGKITVESEPGRGSTFRVWVPGYVPATNSWSLAS